MIDIVFAVVALLAFIFIAAGQFGSDSRDGYRDDHQRLASGG